jgi:hypothetical protein
MTGDVHRAGVAPQFAEHSVAVAPGQHEVEHDQVRPLAQGHFRAFDSVVGLEHLEAGSLQVEADEVGDVLFVLDNQNACIAEVIGPAACRNPPRVTIRSQKILADDTARRVVRAMPIFTPASMRGVDAGADAVAEDGAEFEAAGVDRFSLDRWKRGDGRRGGGFPCRCRHRG